MNWIRENKFLTAFIAVLIVGVGALGYLLYTAWNDYSDVSTQYDAAAATLHQLQSRVPYPDDANLLKYKAEATDLVAATGTLATTLAQMVLPVTDLSPSAFQDRLRVVSTDVTTKAAKLGVKIPASFALDFSKYQTQPPPPAAAGPLGRQLEALNLAVNILLDEHVDSIDSFKRVQLSQEGGVATPPGSRGGGRSGFGARGHTETQTGPTLVEKYPFQVQFTASQPAFQKVLNDFAASGRQFFVTRALTVENSSPKPVAKTPPDTSGTNAAAAPGAPGAPPAAPAAPGAAGFLTFIVGTEKLNVGLEIDVVAFNPPAVKQSK